MGEKLRRSEVLEEMARDELRRNWHRFCDCDSFDGRDTFTERMEALGYVRLRKVRKADVLDEPFAAERGIELGGYLWELTPKGRAALQSPAEEEK